TGANPYVRLDGNKARQCPRNPGTLTRFVSVKADIGVCSGTTRTIIQQFLCGCAFLDGRARSFLEYLRRLACLLFRSFFGQHVLTARLALCLVFGARDVNGHLHANLGMEHDRNREKADCFYGLVEGYLCAADAKSAGADDIGDVARRDGTIELAAIARLAEKH